MCQSSFRLNDLIVNIISRFFLTGKFIYIAGPVIFNFFHTVQDTGNSLEIPMYAANLNPSVPECLENNAQGGPPVQWLHLGLPLESSTPGQLSHTGYQAHRRLAPCLDSWPGLLLG